MRDRFTTGGNPLAAAARRRAARRRPAAGATIAWVVIAMVAMIAVASLAVDLARVRVAKSELQHAADSAARYAAGALEAGGGHVRKRAVDAAGENAADGSPVILDGQRDVEVGVWDNDARTFTPLSGWGAEAANAVRVTARRTAATGNPVPLAFAQVLGFDACDITATAVATNGRLPDSVTTVPARSNPWLAGMPGGTLANVGNPANNPDAAPGQSPALVTDVPLEPGTALSFDAVVGNANNGSPTQNSLGPDGNAFDVGSNFGGAEHGKGNVSAPLNAVMGVFLGDAPPSAGPPPSPLYFSTAAQRDFTTVSPQLKQVFFIGDGRTSRGEIQQFVIPPGATRLYLATMDRYEWKNNGGEYRITIYREGAIKLVK